MTPTTSPRIWRALMCAQSFDQIHAPPKHLERLGLAFVILVREKLLVWEKDRFEVEFAKGGRGWKRAPALAEEKFS